MLIVLVRLVKTIIFGYKVCCSLLNWLFTLGDLLHLSIVTSGNDVACLLLNLGNNRGNSNDEVNLSALSPVTMLSI